MSSLYPPGHHQCNDIEKLIDVIRHFPLGMIVSVSEGKPLITHTPIIYDETTERLVTHIDANNPQVQTLAKGGKISVVFKGPDCYISPSIYSTKQLPTWNYIIVHLEGKVLPIEDPLQIKEFMVRMTDYLEGPEAKFQLALDDPRMEGLIPYIKVFEIEITQWEGKFKLSQDKNEQDYELAKQRLLVRSRTQDESLIKKLYSNGNS